MKKQKKCVKRTSRKLIESHREDKIPKSMLWVMILSTIFAIVLVSGINWDGSDGVVNLNFPANNSLLFDFNLTYNFTGNISTISVPISNYSLYHNFNGSWGLNETVFVSQSVWIPHGFTDDDLSTAQTTRYGYKILTSNTFNVTSLTKYATDVSTQGYVLNAAKGVLDTCSFSGQNCTFTKPFTMADSTAYYFATDAGGGSIQHRRTNTGITDPDEYLVFNITTGLDNGADEPNMRASILGVTVVLLNVTATNFSFDKDVNFGEFKWNVEACATDNTCGFGIEGNYTLNKALELVSATFNSEAFETETQLFQYNITVAPEILSVSSLLNYNNTEFPATSSCTGNNCTLTASIDVPIINNATINQEFFFQTTLFNATDNFVFNLSSGTQLVSQIFFDVCNSTLTEMVLNFTSFDEQTKDRIDPFYIAGEFQFWLGDGGSKKQLSFSNTSASELGLCISPGDKDFFIDDTIEYNDIINSTTYNTRNYYFQQSTINNDSIDHIPLFLLNVDDSTSFILKVQDTNLLPVVDALIHIQRLDVGTGNFTTVSIAKTDDNGQTVGFFKTETVDYRFIITKDGETLLTTGAQKVIPETAPFTLIFTVGEDEGAPWSRFEDLNDLTKTLFYNKTSGVVSFGYEDSSGNFTSSRLFVRLQNLSGSSTTVCDVNSTQASAILTCDTQGVLGTYTASGIITRGSESFLVEQIIFKVETFTSVAGTFGIFLAWFIILVSAFAFKFNEIAGIVLMNLAVIFVNLIGLVNFGYLFIFGMMGVSIIIIVLLER
jgi:hypothetical protein